MEHEKERKHADRDQAREEIRVPTAIETGQAPRPSQAEGERQDVEEDIEDPEHHDRGAG